MRIDSLRVRNFRCFRSQAVELHPEFNVFVGENGAGKTALLEALAVAVGAWLDGIPGLKAPVIEADDVRLIGRTIGGRITFEEEQPAVVTCEGEVSGEAVTWNRVRLNSESSSGLVTDRLRLVAAEAARAVRSFEQVLLPVIAYYGAGRFARQRSSARKELAPLSQRELSRFQGYNDCMAGQIGAGLLARWLEYEERSAFQEERESDAYRIVKTAMQRIVESAEAVRFDNKRLEVVVVFEGDRVRPFGQLSDGQRNMIALAGDIAMRMARLNPHLGEDVLRETPGVVLIDELDLHLHPRWQRHVVADLRRTFPKVQFVTTTHSPQIIGEVAPESVTILRRDGDEVTAHRAHQAYGLDTNRILESLMGADARPRPVQQIIDSVDDAIEEGELDTARERLNTLRQELRGEDGEVARLEASINHLEALATDAVD